MKDLNLESFEDMSDEEKEALLEKLIKEINCALLVAVENKTFSFNPVEKFEVDTGKYYLNVVLPEAENSMFLECIEEVQPTPEQWQGISENLLDSGCGVSVLLCVGEGEDFYDFFVQHSKAIMRLFWELQEERVRFVKAEKIELH